MRIHVVLGLTLALALSAPASAQLAPVPFPNEDCYAPAGDPEPGSAEWDERDRRNMLCAGLRNRDQLASPAYGYQHHISFPGLHLEALAEQAQDPTNPRGGLTTLVPGSRAADPFRTIARWQELTGGTRHARHVPGAERLDAARLRVRAAARACRSRTPATRAS